MEQDLLDQFNSGDIFYHPTLGIKCTIKENKFINVNGKPCIDRKIIKYTGKRPAINEKDIVNILINSSRNVINNIKKKEEEIEDMRKHLQQNVQKLKRLGVNNKDIDEFINFSSSNQKHEQEPEHEHVHEEKNKNKNRERRRDKEMEMEKEKEKEESEEYEESTEEDSEEYENDKRRRKQQLKKSTKISELVDNYYVDKNKNRGRYENKHK
jgi:hypothetical protein